MRQKRRRKGEEEWREELCKKKSRAIDFFMQAQIPAPTDPEGLRHTNYPERRKLTN